MTQIRFEPWGVSVECSPNQSLLDAAREAEIPVGAVCSGRGTCGKCLVRVLDNAAPPPTRSEQATVSAAALGQGFRLACMHRAERDLAVEILPVTSHGKGEAPPLERDFEFAPAVVRHTVMVERPSLERPVDDGSNLLGALAASGVTGISGIDYRAAQALPATLRDGEWRVAVSVYGDTRRTPPHAEVMAVYPAHPAGAPLGLAVDLGTTNIAAYLYNLADGALLGVFGMANPLASYGADILSRLIYAAHTAGNGARPQRILVKALNLLAARATEAVERLPVDIEDMTVVGNSGMHHLFLNLPPAQLIRAPYVPAVRGSMMLAAETLGLDLSAGARIYLPPLVGGFVGSDLLAVALATRIDKKPGVRLALDIGTNTELLLSVDGKLFSCSTASGPALEGAALRFGSVAAAGVVDRVWRDKERGSFGYRTIRGKPAVGICGSGIVEALACMGQAGIFNASGRIQAGKPGVLAQDDGDHRFVLVPAEATALGEDLTISQHDVRAIQLAKGAIRGGVATLLAEHGLAEQDLDEVLVAGTFGNHIEVEAAQAIGLYPAIERERIRQIGNAAGAGAGLMLLSTPERRAAEVLSASINYLELARHKRFTRLFAEGQRFPPGNGAG